MQAKPSQRFDERRRLLLAGGSLCLSWGLPAVAASGEQLVLDYMVSHSARRTAWVRIINEFAAANPDVRVTDHGYPYEPYKRSFPSRLQSGEVDLAFWYAGERLRDAAESKLLAPLDAELVALLKKLNFHPATIEGTRINGEVYGFPMYFYPWGFIYRKSLFKSLGILAPATWKEFLNACERLAAAGVAPLGLGAANGWPAAGWFDYFNLRINGLEFHRMLLRGELPFTDARVRQVFDAWGALLRKGYFLQATMQQEHERVLPYIYRKQVGMMLMGSFIAAKFPAAMADDFDFFAFPSIVPDMPAYEDVPVDVLVLPAKSKNAQARKRFLTFLAESGGVRHLAAADQTLPAQQGPGFPRILLGEAANRVLSNAAGLSSFFDREARADLVTPTFEALRQFLKPPHDTERAVTAIEESRTGVRRTPAPL